MMGRCPPRLASSYLAMALAAPKLFGDRNVVLVAYRSQVRFSHLGR